MASITLELSASDRDRHALLSALSTYNRAAVPNLERINLARDFHVFVRDEDGELCGGIQAKCYWNTLHIDLLWVAETLRGSGTGKRLITAAEDHARASGCALAHVETTSWQALGFYQKSGYALMGTLEDRPVGHATHYLTKRLSPENS